MSTPGIGDPYWYEWYVGVKNIVNMLNPENKIEYVIFQSSTHDTIDDVIVGKNDGFELCYQVKHTRIGENVTFSNLIYKKDKKSLSLLAAIAKGWEKYSSSKARPILYTNKKAGFKSVKRISNITKNSYITVPLEEFLSKIDEKLKTIKSIDSIKFEDINMQEQWIEFLAEIPIDNKFEFLNLFEIKLEQKSLDEMEKDIIKSISKSFKCDNIISNKVFKLLIAELRNWTTTRRKNEKIRREDILEIICDVNIEKSKDILPPMPFFETRKQFCKELYNELNTTSKKVIFLSGNPGSGKTSAVSYINYYYKESIVARFYAFKPISLNDKVYNADSGITDPRNFWISLLNQIRDKFRGKLSKFDIPIISELCSTEVLRNEVIRLSEILYKETNKKSIICIDGIDHAARAECETTFLEQLYNPDEIPEGVIFLIVGQPKNLYSKYPSWIKNVNSQVHEINIPNLITSDIINLIEEKNICWIKKLSSYNALAQMLYEKTGGNNLSVIYALKEAEKCLNLEEFIKVLEEKNISNDIEEYYEMIWRHAENELNKKIKGGFIIDRIACAIVLSNGPINCKVMNNALKISNFDLDDWNAALESLYPLMVKKEDNVYVILHNDLRVFLSKIIKNNNTIYISVSKKIASYYLNTEDESYNRAHNMISLLQIANETPLISEIFNTKFVIECLAEKVAIDEIRKYSILALREGTKIKKINLLYSISEGISTLNQHIKYYEYYDLKYEPIYIINNLEKTNILELENKELSKENINYFYEALMFADRIFDFEPKRAENILNLWFAKINPKTFSETLINSDNIYNTEFYEKVIKLWAKLSYKLKKSNYINILDSNKNDDITNKILSLCMLYNETYMEDMLISKEYDEWIKVFKCGISISFFQGEVIKCIKNEDIDCAQILRLLKKVILNSDNNITKLLSILYISINSKISNDILIEYSKITLNYKKYYTDEEIMEISLWIIEKVITNPQSEEELFLEYEKLLNQINDKSEKQTLFNIFSVSEIIGISIYNKHNEQKIVYSCDTFVVTIKDFLKNKNGYKSHILTKTTNFLLVLLTKLISYIGLEDYFIEEITNHLLTDKRVADFYKKIFLDYLIGKDLTNIVEKYIDLLYGKNGERIFSYSDARSIHYNFKKYVDIVNKDLSTNVESKLKWDVARYQDYKEYSLYSLLEWFGDISDIDTKSWKDEGVRLYNLANTAYPLGSSLGRYEIQLELMEKASKIGIQELWKASSLDFSILESLDNLYSLIIYLLELQTSQESLKLLWYLSIGILSFYNQDDLIGIQRVREVINQKCQELGYRELLHFMEHKTNFLWNISKKERKNYTNTQSDKLNDFLVLFDNSNHEEIINIIDSNLIDGYDKWKQINIAIEYLEEKGNLEKNIVKYIIDLFCKFGYEYDIKRSYLDNIFNRIINHMDEDDYWNVINRIIIQYEHDDEEYSARYCSENIEWFIRKILKSSKNLEGMKECFSMSEQKHWCWITGANHIKVEKSVNIPTFHYLNEPVNLEEFIVNVLLIQLGSNNLHRMEIAYKALNLMCINEENPIKIIVSNWNNLNRIQKEHLYLLAERWIFENNKKFNNFITKLKEDYNTVTTISEKLNLCYILNKYKKNTLFKQSVTKKHDKVTLDFISMLLIQSQFQLNCHEMDIRHYTSNAHLILNDDCIDLKEKLLNLYSYDIQKEIDNIQTRPGDAIVPYSKNSDIFSNILLEEYKKGRWNDYSLVKLVQTFGRSDDGCFMSYYPKHIYNIENWNDDEFFLKFKEDNNQAAIRKLVLKKINDGIDMKKEVCIGANLYVPLNREEGYDFIYSKNIVGGTKREENYYSIIPSYKILYSDEKGLFETDVDVKSLCNKICGLSYMYNSNIRISISNLLQNKVDLKLKSVDPLILKDDKDREVRFEWILYPYRENLHEQYVRYQTLYRWVCNKELFEEFLQNNKIKIIDNIDIQNSQI